MEALAEELKKREAIVLNKEALLAEKSELEIKKLRSSQVLSKVRRGKVLSLFPKASSFIVICRYFVEIDKVLLWLKCAELNHLYDGFHFFFASIVLGHTSAVFPTWRGRETDQAKREKCRW